MQITQPVWVIGMMSGTSLDGVDAALIRTDGEHVAEWGASLSLPYSTAFRRQLYDVLQGQGDEIAASRAIAERHHEAVEKLLQQAHMARADVKLIGFHGQTIWHRPQEGKTCQIGDAHWLAKQTGIAVVHDFRSNDMRHGGQGAPLVPLYHAALAEHLPRPVAIVNIGGVANITWIGEQADANPRVAEGEPRSAGVARNAGEGRRDAPLPDHIIAFDCGPGNALMDDVVHAHTGATFDAGGAIAARGAVHAPTVNHALGHAFFRLPAPKSLDRQDFTAGMVEGLKLEDAMATLAAFTVQSIVAGLQLMPAMPNTVLVTGGGRHNATLMGMLQQHLPGCRVQPVEAVGWDGDMLEAQAFGFLAARSVRGLPLSVPGTTGVQKPVSGGVLVA